MRTSLLIRAFRLREWVAVFHHWIANFRSSRNRRNRARLPAGEIPSLALRPRRRLRRAQTVDIDGAKLHQSILRRSQQASSQHRFHHFKRNSR